MDSQKLKIILVAIISAFASVYLGIAAATDQLAAVAWVVGVAGLVFILALGKHVWLLIPISLGFSGGINAIPGSPAPWWLAMFTVAGMFTLHFIMRINELRYRFTWMDFAILLQVLAIGQAWLRNPAGLNVFGGATVGGKTYFTYAFAIIAYALLAIVKTDLGTYKKAILLLLSISIADGLLMASSVPFPRISSAILPLYSGVSFTANDSGMSDIDTSNFRLVSVKELGQTLGIALLTIFTPLSLANPLRFGRFVIFATAMFLVMLSGFRSVIGMFAILFFVGSWVRGRKQDILFALLITPLVLSLVIFSGLTKKLPFGAQRILSVLPIEVEDRARIDGEKSSDWRFEMWELALFTDRYIDNKFLGDGFGFRADEQKAMADAALGDYRASSNVGSMQDQMLAKGSYHGFHVEAIRFTGALGLVFALIGMGIFLRCALTQIRYFKGRKEWGCVLYVCIPFLIHPFYYMLVFGSYRNGFSLMLISAGLLKMLDNIRRDELYQHHSVPALTSAGNSQQPLRTSRVL